MVRYHHPGTPDRRGSLRTLPGHYAPPGELPAPFLHHPRHIVPTQRRVEHLSEVMADRHRAASHVDVVFQLRQPECAPAEVIDRPTRLDRELRHAGRVQPERNGETGPLVPLTVPPGDAVHRQ